jgi:hypothetical protein
VELLRGNSLERRHGVRCSHRLARDSGDWGGDGAERPTAGFGMLAGYVGMADTLPPLYGREQVVERRRIDWRSTG